MLTQIRQLLYRPPDEKAQGPWSIYWSDHELNSYGDFQLSGFREVIDWVRANRDNYPETRVIIRSQNDYIYELDPDDNNIKFIQLERGIHDD